MYHDLGKSGDYLGTEATGLLGMQVQTGTTTMRAKFAQVWQERVPTLWLQNPWYLSVESRNELQLGKCAHYTGIVYDSMA